MDIECKECGGKFIDDKSLHHHLKLHKLKIGDYYLKHFRRKDLYNNELIPFKNFNQYFETDFLSKTNLRMWLKGQGKDVQREYCTNLLKGRIDKKGLKYSPSQVELRSLPIPACNFYHNLFNGYNDFCIQLGLKTRFSNYPGDINYESVQNKVKHIICDSREAKPLNLDFSIEISKLDFGDYCLDNPELNERIYIERKSLPDLISSMTRGYERFTSELERCISSQSYLVILVEEKIEHALSFNFLPHIHSKMNPDHVFHGIRDLLQKYKEIQFIFCNGRKESARIAKRILFENGLTRNCDLQLMLDIGLL